MGNTPTRSPALNYAIGLGVITFIHKTQRHNLFGLFTSILLLPPYITLRHVFPHHYTLREHLCISVLRAMGALHIKYIRWVLKMEAKILRLVFRPTTSRVISTKCSGIWYGDADLDDNAAVVLYVHGGAYCFGNPGQYPDAHGRLVDDLIRLGVPCRILSLEYSLAPETAFPIPIQQVLLAYSYLCEDLRIRPSRIIFAGDSAGAGLCLAATQKLRESQLPLPAALVLISPWVNMHETAPSFKLFADDDLLPAHFSEKAHVSQYAEHYLQGHSIKDPLASPLFADLTGFPPMCITVGGRERFYDDIMLFIDKAKTAGVHVTSVIDPTMPHIYPIIPIAFSSKSYTALFLISKFISTTLRSLRQHVVQDHSLPRNRFSDSQLI